MIAVVTKVVFISADPQKADLLFVFGSSYGDMWNEVVELYHKGLASVVYIAGGIGNKSFDTGKILSHLIKDEFVGHGVPAAAIVVDERSTNTLEDAIFGKQLFIEKGIPHGKVLFACKAPHSGRCLRTLKKVFPDSHLFPFTYNFIYNGKNITAANWFADEESRQIVWAEYQRILLYSSRGDICA